MHVRVQLPAKNEARTLEGVVQATLAVLDTLAGDARRTSVLVIDDGSVDDTRRIALALAAADARVAVLPLERSAGLGNAFRAGVERSLQDGVDVLVNLDADGQFDPRHLVTVAGPVLAGVADLVIGSRFLDVKPEPPLPLVREWGNHALAAVVSWLSGVRVADACCGLRAFSRRALVTMRLREDFTYTQETLLQCAWSGLVVEEVAVPVRGVRAVGRSRVARSVVRYGARVTAILARAWLGRQRFRLAGAPDRAKLLEDQRSL